MFELARLAAEVETAVALARKATGSSPELLVPCARLHGGAAARDVAMTGLRVLQASGRYTDEEVEAFRRAIRFDDLMASSIGEMEEMDRVAKALLDGWPRG